MEAEAGVSLGVPGRPGLQVNFKANLSPVKPSSGFVCHSKEKSIFVLSYQMAPDSVLSVSLLVTYSLTDEGTLLSCHPRTCSAGSALPLCLLRHSFHKALHHCLRSSKTSSPLPQVPMSPSAVSFPLLFHIICMRYALLTKMFQSG